MSRSFEIDLNHQRLGENLINSVNCLQPARYRCICCLGRNTRLINLSLCRHAGLLRDLSKLKLELDDKYVCYLCHEFLKKLAAFQQQVEESHLHLTESIPLSITKIPNLTVEKCQSINITMSSETNNSERKLATTFTEDPVKSVNVALIEKELIRENVNILEDQAKSEDNISDQDTPCTGLKMHQVCKKGDTELKEELMYNDRIRKLMYTREQASEERERARCDDAYTHMEYKCETCILGFNNISMVLEHKAKRHDQNNKLVCSICASTFKTKPSYNQHMKRHFMRFECVTCGQRYISSTSAVHHCDMVHAANEKAAFWCADCDYTTPSHRVMRYHKEKHKGPNKCPHCNKVLSSATVLRAHIMHLHRADAGRRPTPAARRAPRPQHCQVCGVTYRTPRCFAAHLRTSPRHRALFQHQYTCDHCQATFYYKYALEAHIKWRHLHISRFKCALCNDKPFRRNSDLKKHHQLVHEKLKVERPRCWICEYCGQGFMRRATLRDHTTRHTRERPHRCAACAATFAQPAALYNHTRRLHPAT